MNPLRGTDPKKDYFITDAHGYDQFDYRVDYSGKTYLVETKVRECSSTFYPDIMIEEPKFNYLIAEAYASGVVPLYQCFYTDSVYVLFDLRKCLDVQTQVKSCNKTKAGQDRGYVPKRVKMLPLEKAQQYSYVIPSDKLVEDSFNHRYTVIY
ncbi:hypothetical protein EFA69_06430 [Rufibacter immobilis]|uniref:Uncharacterized protein n=1 Tax=Rufibacter immobilis TaxID=1348778 RepID=A0A3M9N193_9BACT|nr:hypothetical protein [Rufibacter immobilis]RNI30923.1 hypothetical protein EFA69_06430 [Rufibacter immobilis]